jgi:protein-disulfide isomerase
VSCIQGHVMEFGDFQCPYCARLAHVLDTVAARVPGGIRVYFRQYPLPIHPYARAAAVASECAAVQGRFDEFFHLAYWSDKPLSEVTAEEGRILPDARAYRRCVGSAAPERRIALDSAAAVQLGVTGTPGVLAGDVLFVGAPSADLLDSVIKAQTWK